MSSADRLAAWSPPVAVSLAVVAATLAAVAVSSAAAGMWAYPLDDTYIHLEVAWRLLQDGTWGLNPGEAASASSSPLWTLLLTVALGLAGHRAEVALALGLASAVAVVFAADGLLRDADLGVRGRLAGLGLVALLAPLPVLAVLGMEHALQAALALVVARAVGRDPLRPSGLALVTVGLLCVTRIEGVFLAAAWAALCMVHGARGAGLRVLGAAALPLGAWALGSLGLGNLPVPNGYLMKSGLLQGGALDHLGHNLREGMALWALVGLAGVFELGRRGRLSPATGVLGLTTALQLGLGGVGWYYRYEAWLVAWAVVAAVGAGAGWWRRSGDHRAWVLAGLALLVALGASGRRAADAFRYLPGRVTYIADAKVRLARALAQVDPHAVVALHDVGAMAWETDLPLLDTAGLGSNEVLRLHLRHALDADTLGRLSAEHHVTVGLATASWLADAPPTGWRPAARLQWGLDADRRIEPLVAYAVAPGSEATVQAWLRTAAALCGERAQAEAWDGGQWVVLE